MTLEVLVNVLRDGSIILLNFGVPCLALSPEKDGDTFR